MENNAAHYPKYYRGGTLCLKRTGDTTTIEIVVPEQNKTLPLSHQNTTYPDKQRLDKYLIPFEEVSQAVYEEYLVIFFRTAAQNRDEFNKAVQARLEKKKQQTVSA